MSLLKNSTVCFLLVGSAVCCVSDMKDEQIDTFSYCVMPAGFVDSAP